MTGYRTIGRLLLLLLTAIAAIAAVSYGIQAYRDKVPKSPKITVVTKTTAKSLEFWQVLKDGVNVAAKEFDARVSIVGPNNETDVDDQIALLERVIRDRPDAVVMAATDFNRLVPVAKRIEAAGIPLISIDSGLNSDIPRSFIATDNVEAGRKAGRILAKLAGDRGKVAIISFVRGTASQIDRERGVRSIFEAASGFDIIGTYYSDGVEKKAYETTMELLGEHRDLAGIVCLNEPASVGAGRAVKELGLAGKITLVGFDSSINEVRLLEEGVMQATVVQRPFNMGYLGVKTAIDVLKGDKVAERIDTGSVVITKQNMYEDENQKLLFPFVER
jgi:ribose transport system substrate-binding protein